MTEIKVQRLDRSCYPCAAGDHEKCRHHPNDDGSQWVADDDGKKRLVLYADKWKREEIPRPPCSCEEGGHVGDPGTCNMWISDKWVSHRCSRPAKGTMPQTKFTYAGQNPPEAEACGIHLAGYRRRMANEEARAEKVEVHRSEARKRGAASKASKDWAERLHDEFGLPTEGMKSHDGEINVSMPPEVAYKVLSEVRGLLDEVYVEHPFGSRKD